MMKLIGYGKGIGFVCFLGSGEIFSGGYSHKDERHIWRGRDPKATETTEVLGEKRVAPY
jgi:hypothetical protein